MERAVTTPVLNPREIQVARELARAKSNKEIARTLGLAVATIKIHIKHIQRKRLLPNRVAIAVWYATNFTDWKEAAPSV